MTVLTLSYLLPGFEDLRRLVVERILRRRTLLLPATFRKRWSHHAFNVVSLVGFALLGWVVTYESPVVAYGSIGLVAGMVLWEYLTTVCEVVVGHDHLQLQWPLADRRLAFTDVTAVTLGRDYRWIPEVRVFVQGRRKPIRLQRLGIEAIRLYDAVSRTWSASQPVPPAGPR